MIDKTRAALEALQPKEEKVVDPATAKKIEVLKNTLAAKEAALAAAATDEEKAKLQTVIDKTRAALAALGA